MEALIGMMFVLFWCVLGIGGTVFWIWMLVDCAKHEPREGNDRIVWVLVIALTHFVGALIYFFARRPDRIREAGE